MSTHIHPAIRAREVAMENAGLLPNPAIGQAVDSDAVRDLKYAEAIGTQGHQPFSAGIIFYFNNTQYIDSL